MKPIHCVSIQGSVSTFKVLINLGADPRSPRENDVRIFYCVYLTTYVCIHIYIHIYILCNYIHIRIYVHVYLLLYSLEDSPFIMHVLRVTCHW